MQRFVDAGFVLLGKTTTSEFGAVPLTESEALGTSRNPCDPDRTPGGYSSGRGRRRRRRDGAHRPRRRRRRVDPHPGVVQLPRRAQTHRGLVTDDDPMMALLNSYPMGVFTSLFNLTGQPAMSLPIHHDEATDLPVGVQIVAAPWREDLLLQVSRSLELAHPWSERRPPVG